MPALTSGINQRALQSHNAVQRKSHFHWGVGSIASEVTSAQITPVSMGILPVLPSLLKNTPMTLNNAPPQEVQGSQSPKDNEKTVEKDTSEGFGTVLQKCPSEGETMSIPLLQKT
ncbi:hypothetical protein BS17DRAFT_763584 [Gyrodon lividus]|nr:hypothetical protein BS17DRAFT_763584 [Gyrodon lividus]